jgi:hypothetical protein
MSSRDLGDLHYLLRPLADEFFDQCRIAKIDARPTCTYRSFAEQDHLYACGRTIKSHVGPWTLDHPLGAIVTHAKGGHSEHGYTLDGEPAALAFDVAVFVYGKPVWDEKSPLWIQTGAIGMALDLNWYGAPNAPFHEACHFALRESKVLMAASS